MYSNSQKLTSVVVFMCIITMLCFGESAAANLTVKIVASPNKTDIYTGSEPIALTAQASGVSLTFKWSLIGPGEIEGNDLPAVFYLVPEQMSEQSAKAVITVTVTDKTGQKAAKSITFTILADKTSTPEPEPEPTKKGMSTRTKAALGVGAAAVLGGGIALALMSDNEGDDTPTFTGTFRNEFDKWTNDGTTAMHVINIFKLRQNGNSVTGTMEASATFGNCCTASFSISVTGTVNGNAATLSWPYAEDWCSGDNCLFGLDSAGGMDYYAELVDNGRILRIYDYGDISRMSIMNCSKIGNKLQHKIELPISGDFIRQ